MIIIMSNLGRLDQVLNDVEWGLDCLLHSIKQREGEEENSQDDSTLELLCDTLSCMVETFGVYSSNGRLAKSVTEVTTFTR